MGATWMRLLTALLALCLTVGGSTRTSVSVIGGADGPTAVFVAAKKGETEEKDMAETTYIHITQEEARRVMDSGEPHIVLDVREQDEYDGGHIPGAILLPYTRVEELADGLLPDREATILVYCRSGRRSVIAAQALADMGYTDVREFGGILDWQYDIVT